MSEAQPQTAVIGEAYTRFIRQLDFVPPNSLEDQQVTIIGCGAIGRQVAIQLAAIGVRRLTLIDFDTVTPTNVTTQGFLAADVGKEKVVALADAILDIDPEIVVVSIVDRFRPNQGIEGVVFICVDKIEARSIIWKALKDKVSILLDGRMLGETMQVLAVGANEDSKANYEKTLFPPSEQAEGRCTGHATIYCATIAAGLMVHQFTRHLRGFMLDGHTGLNLLAGELLPIVTY